MVTFLSFVRECAIHEWDRSIDEHQFDLRKVIELTCNSFHRFALDNIKIDDVQFFPYLRSMRCDDNDGSISNCMYVFLANEPSNCEQQTCEVYAAVSR